MQNVLFNVQSREIWIWHVRPSTPATRDWRFRIVISCTCQKHGGDTSIAAKCDYFAKIMQTRIFRIRNINVVFFFFFFTSIYPFHPGYRSGSSLTRTTRVFSFQILDVLLSGSPALLVITLSSDAVSWLADGIRSFGCLVGRHQKSGHLSILRRLPDPNLQSLHGLRGKNMVKKYVLAFVSFCE